VDEFFQSPERRKLGDFSKMSEDPIKLFSTRSERYPEPSEADTLLAGARATLTAIPVLGGSLTEILSLVLAPAVTKRRDEWFKELANALEELETKVEGFRTEQLQNDEIFVSAVIQATRTAASTHQQEKREALRNALLNTALHRTPVEDELQMFLRYIDEMTVWHLRVLQLFQNPSAALQAKNIRLNYYAGGPHLVLEAVYPELKGKRDFYDQIVADVKARGMINSSADFLHTLMTGAGMTEKRTTAIADNFLEFIKRPF
jgi:hypothetical protein